MITIRKAAPADIEILIHFQQRLAGETESMQLDRDLLRTGIQAMFDDPSRGLYYMAEFDGEVAGCHMITYEWSDWRNGTVWWLQSVYIRESMRKRGIFKAMYDNLTKMIAADDGVSGLRLYVEKSNHRAQQTYRAMGMNGDHYFVFEKMKG